MSDQLALVDLLGELAAAEDNLASARDQYRDAELLLFEAEGRAADCRAAVRFWEEAHPLETD